MHGVRCIDHQQINHHILPNDVIQKRPRPQASSTGAPQQSLWHAMQQRQQAARDAAAQQRGDDLEASFSGVGGGGDEELFGFDGGGLFAEEGGCSRA
jgi:hypothetical protein